MLPFKTITQACAHRDPETKLLVSEIQRVLFKNLNELEQYEARLKREYELQMKIKHETLSGGRVKVEDKLMDITSDPLLVAQQLMLIEEERLSAIGPEEFMQAFVKDDPDAEASELARSSHNLEAYVDAVTPPGCCRSRGNADGCCRSRAVTPPAAVGHAPRLTSLALGAACSRMRAPACLAVTGTSSGSTG